MADAASNPRLYGLERVGDSRDILGECPTWDARFRLLWWVDIRRPALHRLEPSTRQRTSWDLPGMVGALALCEGTGIVLALENRIAQFDPETGGLKTLAQAPAIAGHRFNDGRVDRQGRFWVGTMHNLTRAPEGKLYRLDRSGLTPVLDTIAIPNSLAWSPDSTRMYFSDSLSYRLDAYDFDAASGTLGQRHTYAQTCAPAFPDGAAVDAHGHVWLAEFNGGRVVRRGPDGDISAIISTPVDRPTACALGGADLRTLYITSTCQNMSDVEKDRQPLAGALFAARVDVPGLPEPRLTLLPS